MGWGDIIQAIPVVVGLGRELFGGDDDDRNYNSYQPAGGYGGGYGGFSYPEFEPFDIKIPVKEGERYMLDYLKGKLGGGLEGIFQDDALGRNIWNVLMEFSDLSKDPINIDRAKSQYIRETMKGRKTAGMEALDAAAGVRGTRHGGSYTDQVLNLEQGLTDALTTFIENLLTKNEELKQTRAGMATEGFFAGKNYLQNLAAMLNEISKARLQADTTAGVAGYDLGLEKYLGLLDAELKRMGLAWERDKQDQLWDRYDQQKEDEDFTKLIGDLTEWLDKDKGDFWDLWGGITGGGKDDNKIYNEKLVTPTTNIDYPMGTKIAPDIRLGGNFGNDVTGSGVFKSDDFGIG